MAATKRKQAPSNPASDAKKQKKSGAEPAKKAKPNNPVANATFKKSSDHGTSLEEDESRSQHETTKSLRQKQSITRATDRDNGNTQLDSSSAEAHAKQRALAKERKANKPNADVVQRSKKIWERLRRKSHVAPEERKKLVTELFDLINGRVRDFVFKHDSVRVIQCALKYANRDQRKGILNELKADIRSLTESKYGKFLVAKMVIEGNQDVRDSIVPEFYGHIRRLINHPEASWIVDDIYRQIASKHQKTTMLQEWYGAEFALLHRQGAAPGLQDEAGDLANILDRSPEKRKPVLQYLLHMINSLVQKKMTGFTMLHDAMLQYFTAVTPGSEEQKEFLELLKGDIEKDSENGGDLFKNLAFTRSGSKLVCLALAYGTAKDRKVILKVFKDTVEAMAFDQFAKLVLVTGLEVTDDTKSSSRAVLHELLGLSIDDQVQRLDHLEQVVTHLHARVPVMMLLAGMAKWLIQDQDLETMAEILEIRKGSSKKPQDTRRNELLQYTIGPLLDLVSERAQNLVQTSFGCVFISEILLASIDHDRKQAAKYAVANLAVGDPTVPGHVAENPFASRMLKTLVVGGSFDPEVKRARLCEPPLGFGATLFPLIRPHLVEWACGGSSFVIVALLESDDVSNDVKAEARSVLKSSQDRLKAAASGERKSTREASGSGGPPKPAAERGNVGSKILLEKLVM